MTIKSKVVVDEPSKAEIGTCRACGQELIKWNGDIWHPHNVPARCPVNPYGRPGEKNFILDEEATRAHFEERYPK